MTTRDLRPIETLDIPLDKIGLNPKFQPRMAIDPDWVRHLVEETDPDAWDPIWVRRWPESDTSPRPPGCEHAVYEVASGFTRTVAARQKGLTSLTCAIYDCPDDGDFLMLAAKGNARHGVRLTNEEQVRQAKRLSEAGKSQGDIAKALGFTRQTVSNWLSGRNSNAARQARHALSEPRGDEVEVADAWVTTATVGLGDAGLRRVGSVVSDILATVPPESAPPADVLAWVASLEPIEREQHALDARAARAWVSRLATALGATATDAEGEVSV